MQSAIREFLGREAKHMGTNIEMTQSRNGRQRFISRLVLRCIPDVVVKRRVPLLGPFAFRLRRHRWLMSNRCFDGHARNLSMFRMLVHPGDVVFDVGANIGYYTRYIAHHLQPSRLLAFEPMSGNAEILERNVQLGDVTSIVHVVRSALSDHDAQEDLQVDDVMGGSAVLDSIARGRPSQGREHVGLGPRTERVRVQTLDSFLNAEGELPPDMMKIDTEGAELLVLTGASKLLRDHPPRLLIATHGADRAREVVQLLDTAHYVCFGFVRTDGEIHYQRLDPNQDWKLADNNILASTRLDDVKQCPDARIESRCR